MTRRLRLFTTLLLAMFVMLVAQAINVQWLRAPSLNVSPLNPRTSTVLSQFPRGEIVAADGTILARSIATNNASFPYQRSYPLGSLTSDVVGFAGPEYGTWAIENEYNSYLEPHAQPPQSLAQVFAPTSAADNVNLTIYPALQQIARVAMAGQVGAAVVLNPKTGAVMGMYSNPNYDPTPFTTNSYTTAKAAWIRDTTADAYGYEPLGNAATQQTFAPGSTFKVITTAAAAAYKPALLTKAYKVEPFTTLPDTNKLLYNDGGAPCGGTVAQMLPPSCDPGYALLGLDIGAQDLSSQAYAFGYNSVPPIDLPTGEVNPSYFPSAASFSNALPTLAYSAIGQENVRATALQQVLVAAAVANGGQEMTPHLLSSITDPLGKTIQAYTPSVWKSPLTKHQASEIVPLMVNVARYGTAAGIFSPQDDVGAKTGTAQTFFHGVARTNDWMIAFAPATNPTVAVAVAMPFQSDFHYGATTAGPIVKCLLEGALAIEAHLPPTGTSTTCPS